MKKEIAVTKNGIVVFGIINNEHMIAHSQVQDNHISEAIAEISLEAPFFMESVDLGKNIGFDNCIEVTDNDDVRMMRRIGRRGDSRIVFGKKAAPTSLITVGVCLDDDGLYTLFTAFYGQKAPKEPWDCRNEEELTESEAFWLNHALVYTRDEDFTIN